MEEAFNPYRQWLGIPSGRRPEDHYELLGIARFERDPTVIARAADVLTARLRSIRPGPHVAEWQRLIDVVAGAKTCLLDPRAKAAYDASLRGPTPDQPAQPRAAKPWEPDAPQSAPAPTRQRPTPPSTPPPTPPAAPPTAAQESGRPDPLPQAAPLNSPGDPEGGAAAPAVVTRPVRARRGSGSGSGAPAAVYLLAVSLLAVAGVFGYVLYERRGGAADDDEIASQADPAVGPSFIPEDPAEDPEGRRAAPPREPSTDRAKRNPKSPARPRPAAKRPSSPKTRPKPLAPGDPVDEQLQLAFQQAVAEARTAMADHDLAAARELLDSAAENAQTPKETAEFERLATLLDHLGEFWRVMRRVVARIQSADTVPVGDTFVAIVEAAPDELTIKAGGQIRTYPTDRLPPKLIQALADDRFADDAATKAIVGSYYLIDPDADPARARQLWSEAARQGVEVEHLLPELTRWGKPAEALGAPPPPERAGPPSDEGELHEAEEAVRQRFQAGYAEGTSLAGKDRLAARLLDAARATPDAPTLQFVLLREARDMAIAAGNPAVACQAVDELAGAFRVDALAMKAVALGEASRSARGFDAQRKIAEIALGLVGDAISTDRTEEAVALAETALAAARKSNSRTLMEEAVSRVEEAKARREEE